MTVYTILPEDDLNLEVVVTDPNDPRIAILDDITDVTVTEQVVTIDITPASINLTGAVNSVNGFTGVVSLTTTEIPEGSNEYYTDARADARVDLQTGANLDLSFMDTDDLAEGPTNLYSKQPNSTTDDVTFNSMTGDMFGVSHFTAKARETITAGQPVYISGHSGNTPEVMVADYTDPAKMPAFGIASADIANNNNGSISTYGDLKNVDTTGTTEGETWVVGDVLYVDGSNLTNVRPSSETQAVQSLAKVIRVHANNGQMFLSGAGRVNDVPNLDHYHVFIGNAGGVEKRQLTYTDILNTPSLAAYITASSTDTLTNKSGNISMFTNDANYSTTTGTVTPSSTDTFTNKSGAISQWTNDAGYLTSETDNQTLSFATPDLSISSGNSVNLTPLITGLITASSTDTLTNKSGSNSQWTNTEAYIKADSTDTLTNKSGSNNQWTNDAGYITSSALTPYYTSTQVSALPVSTFTNDAGYSTTTGTVTPSSTDVFTNKSGNISQWTNDSGYLTSETDSQTLTFTSPNLAISNGNSQDLSALTDGGTY